MDSRNIDELRVLHGTGTHAMIALGRTVGFLVALLCKLGCCVRG